MPAVRRVSRIDTLNLKFQIEKRLGSQKAEKYFSLLTKYLSLKLRKQEFNKLCISLIGRENIRFHNQLIIAIVQNANVCKTPPQKHVKTDGPNGTHLVTDLQSLCAFPQSPKKGRTPNLRERKFKDRAVTTKLQQQSATELFSLGSKPPLEVNSVEDGEEVEQHAISPGVYSRSPVKAPLGINIHSNIKQKIPSTYQTESCHYSGHLPDADSLKNRVAHNVQVEGLDVSMDCVDLLTNGLDCFLKSVVKPSLELVRSRGSQRSGVGTPFLTSMLDFRMATEIDSKILGKGSHVLHEKC